MQFKVFLNCYFCIEYNSIKFKMEKLAKYTTIIYALLWFLGFILSYSFYSLFFIDIVEYLDFTEIFFGFFTNILEVQYSGRIIFFMTFYLSIFFIIYRVVNDMKIILILLIPTISIILCITALAFLVKIGFNISIWDYIPIYFNPLIIICLFFFVLKLYAHYGLKIKGKLGIYIDNFNLLTVNKISWPVFIFLISYLFTAYTLYRSQQSKATSLLKDDIRIKEVSFLYNNTPIQTDSVVFYVGGTKNNLFLYNRKTKETFIYEKNNLTNLKYQRMKYKDE